MSFLDVAAGTGALTIPAAQMGAKVTAVDISSKMVGLLRQRVEKEGLSNVEGYVMDGHALEFEDDKFDMSGSQFGVMLFPDLPKGLSEMVRVTRPGGKVLIISFSAPERVDFLKYFFGALQIVVPNFEGFPKETPPLPFQVSDPEVLKIKMIEAGLEEVYVGQDIEKFMSSNSGKELWDTIMNSNPIALQLTADLTEKQKKEVQQILEDMIRGKSNGEDYAVLTAELNIGVGRKK